MSIFVCGINHKTAPLALREKVIFVNDKLVLYLQDLLQQEQIQEAVLLSTCNRSELYCEADNAEKVMQWFCRQQLVATQTLLPHLYIHQDQEAIEHIMCVASGLDSMVLGESEILGQMKNAFSESCAAGSVGTLFNRLFQQVFSVAKEIRHATAIGACPVSISSAAVNFIKENYREELKTATCLLVGSGDAARLTLRHLKNLTPKKILIASRNAEQTKFLTQDDNVDALPLEKISTALLETDIIISATGSLVPVITKSMLLQRARPLFIVDIAVPRDVEEAVAEIPRIQLFSIDDLKVSIQKNLQGREHAAKKAREMITQKIQDFMLFLHSHRTTSMAIRAYRKHIEDVCQNELVKSMRKLKRGDNAEQVLANFALAMTNKLLHAPSVQLRQASAEGRFEILALAQQLLAIPLPEAPSV
ncbi:hypothetical protein AYO45_06825 [Gammaproteobacteria bacterium SCGC AG-212-F23]|nr:hypothetical protein AYO45_06825 [Gammaproteobacteria bacterium SCGC AG-212-F23]